MLLINPSEVSGEERPHPTLALALALALTLTLTLARWAEVSALIDTVVEKDASNNLLPRYHMHMVACTLQPSSHPHPDPRPRPNPDPDPNPNPSPNPNR